MVRGPTNGTLIRIRPNILSEREQEKHGMLWVVAKVHGNRDVEAKSLITRALFALREHEYEEAPDGA